ncbi:hypothetical protein [Streptomyces sp. NPDC048111]|uniref:hypothetical protein n=1 Tax=Streptomyces sp. NPDC048111 TaxID=3365500 RepID=UPI0037117E0D
MFGNRSAHEGPSPEVLRAVLAGLRRRLEPEEQALPEVLPVPGCDICRAASGARAGAHMAGSPVAVRQATHIIRSHPHGAGAFLNLDAWELAEFARPRPGSVDPRVCAECALIKLLAVEVVAADSRALAARWAELAYRHAELGHPSDRRRTQRRPGSNSPTP